MYLSKLLINPRSRNAHADISDRYELHRTIMKAYPESLPDDERILYRVEDNGTRPIIPVLVQSQHVPRWEQVERLQKNYLLDGPQVRQVKPDIQTGQRLFFRLQANPTVKRNGKRHAIFNDEQLIVWLQHKAEQHGFSCTLPDIQVVKLGNRYGKRHRATWHAVQFDGVLTITEADRFSNALLLGIGSAKAFGFGLLSINYSNR